VRAILVSVDYADILSVTLPYNRHHFTDVYVITTNEDKETQRVCSENQTQVLTTDLFYRYGAAFNKWGAMEYGFNMIGRTGWLCMMDADVLIPKEARFDLNPGCIHSCRRNIIKDLTQCESIPTEESWSNFPTSPYDSEPAIGYLMAFYAQDAVLKERPWFRKVQHAGAADSYFHERWKPENKIQLPFSVLHLGEDRRNWCGRVTRGFDGQLPKSWPRSQVLFNKQFPRGA
jgi:hypothetical protein